MNFRYVFALMLIAFATMAMAQQDMFGNPSIRWQTFGRGDNSLSSKPMQRLLVTQGDAERHLNAYLPGIKIPRGFDFSKEWIIAIHAGERRTGGYSTFVESIQKVNGEVLIEFVDESPNPRTKASQSLTTPFVLVRVDAFTGNPVFKSRAQVCRNISTTRPSCWTPCVPTYPINLAFDVLDHGPFSNIRNQSNVFIYSDREWKDYWYNGLGKDPDTDPAPNVADFRYDMVVGIHVGNQFRVGGRIILTDVKIPGPGSVEIRYSFKEPPVTNVSKDNSPYVVLVIPRGLGMVNVYRNIGVPYGS